MLAFVKGLAMCSEPSGVFDDGFLIAIRALVNVHHSIYPQIPPQGIYFEALVAQAFRQIRKPFTTVTPSRANLSGHDLLVENHRLSLKTETGRNTKADTIHVTKLCTTEKDPWTAETLVQRTVDHLSRYDLILMLRAVWELPLIRYQLIEIPIVLLNKLASATYAAVGNRRGRQSIGADVCDGDDVLFHVHFDGSDGKCQIRKHTGYRVVLEI